MICSCRYSNLSAERDHYSADIMFELEQHVVSVLHGKESILVPLMCVVDNLLIELCASNSSELTEQVPYRFAALLITDKEDLTRSNTVNAIISIMRIAYKQGVKIRIWASTSRISGCPCRHVHAALGPATGGKKLSDKLIEHASRICRFAIVCGGHYTWEWPERCAL